MGSQGPRLHSGPDSKQARAFRPMPFIVGSPRSGTTLLRFMLDSHPELAIPPETGFLTGGKYLLGRGFKGIWRHYTTLMRVRLRKHSLRADELLRDRFSEFIIHYPPHAPAWQDFGIPTDLFLERLGKIRPFSSPEGFRLFYRMYAERFDKSRYGDKTPSYCRHLLTIERLLPEARFVHIIRDGRDVAVSLRNQWFSPGKDIDVLAHYWLDHVSVARKQGARCGNYLELRYEDLVFAPESALQRVCVFLELNYHPQMIHYHERTKERLQEHLTRFGQDGSVIASHEDRLRQQAMTMHPPNLSRIGVWKQILSEEERKRFHKTAGWLLSDLGYAE